MCDTICALDKCISSWFPRKIITYNLHLGEFDPFLRGNDSTGTTIMGDIESVDHLGAFDVANYAEALFKSCF